MNTAKQNNLFDFESEIMGGSLVSITERDIGIGHKIHTKLDALLFITALGEQNRVFHYDDPPETIVDGLTGARLFEDGEAQTINQRLSEIYSRGFCPFELTSEIMGDL